MRDPMFIFAGGGEPVSLDGSELKLYRSTGLKMLFGFSAVVCLFLAGTLILEEEAWKPGLTFLGVAVLLWFASRVSGYHMVVNLPRGCIEREQSFAGLAVRSEVARFSDVMGLAVDAKAIEYEDSGHQEWSHRVVIVLVDGSLIEASDFFKNGFSEVCEAARMLAEQMGVPCLHGEERNLMAVRATGEGKVQVLFGPGKA